MQPTDDTADPGATPDEAKAEIAFGRHGVGPHAQLVHPIVLKQMAAQRLAALQRGEITKEFFEGYVIAMFHAGALTEQELRELLNESAEGFHLV